MYKRIMIFGRPGAGKSTFALNLSQKTGNPLYHLDRYFFVENWVERDKQEFLQIQQSLVDQDRWIIDGNSIRSLGMRYARADLVLYFNYPRWLCYWRVFKRLFIKNPAILDRASGCDEQVSYKLLKYMWSFEERVAQPIQTLQTQYPIVKFMEIRRERDLNAVVELFE